MSWARAPHAGSPASLEGRRLRRLAPLLVAMAIGSTAAFGKTQGVRREHDIFQQCLQAQCGRDSDLCRSGGGLAGAAPAFNGPLTDVCARSQACAEDCADRARSSY